MRLNAGNKDDCIKLGTNKALGFTGDIVSNYIVFYGSAGVPLACLLDSRFKQTDINTGKYYYADRSYTIVDGIPSWMVGKTLIQTLNDERNNNASNGYIRFTNPFSGWVYVLFDSRSASIPNWLQDWELKPDDQIETSLSSQPYLKVYQKMFDTGQCVDIGGNYGPGSSNEIRSNYIVVYGQ